MDAVLEMRKDVKVPLLYLFILIAFYNMGLRDFFQIAINQVLMEL